MSDEMPTAIPSARLIEVDIDSFKAYREQVVDLGPLTVIIGPNGSGKTTLLQTIELLGAIVTGDLGAQLESRGWAYADLPHLRRLTKQFGFEAIFELGRDRLSWEIRLGARRSVEISRESVLAQDGTVLMRRQGRTMSRLDRTTGETESVVQTLASSWLSTVDVVEDVERFPELVAIATWARRNPGYLALDPSRLREPSRKAARLGPNGESLPGVLRTMLDAGDGAFERVVDLVRDRYASLQGVHVKRGVGGWNRIEVTERWGAEEVTLNAKQVSDGLLRLIAIATLAEVADPPSVVLIDEVENGVHPHLLGGLMGLLRDVSARGIQVIVTTHSPIALNDAGSADHVLLARRSASGEAELIPLSRTPGFEELGDHFDLGELWYNLGEDRLVRGPDRRRVTR